MRITTIVAALFVALSAAGQQEPLNRLHLFVANPSFSSSDARGSNWDAGYGFAYQRAISPRWAAELSVMREREHSNIFVSDANGNFVMITRRWYRTPVDVAALYHFGSEQWRSYAGPALRWAGDLDEPGDPGRLLYGAEAGVIWQFHDRLGLRLDAKVLVANSVWWSSQTNGSIGLSWRF